MIEARAEARRRHDGKQDGAIKDNDGAKRTKC